MTYLQEIKETFHLAALRLNKIKYAHRHGRSPKSDVIEAEKDFIEAEKAFKKAFPDAL